MAIYAYTMLLILDIYSTTIRSHPQVSLSTYSTASYNTCTCSGVVPSEQCLLNEMFASLDFFMEGTTKLVCQNVSATVRPVHRSPTLQTMLQFEQFNAKCLTQTDCKSDYLSINDYSHCSSSYKCCVMCSRCPRDRIINDEGPVIVRPRIYVHDLKTSQFILLIKCATTSPQPVAGYQVFEIRLSNRDCSLTEPTSTITPKMSGSTTGPCPSKQTTETETSSVSASTATTYKILMTTDNPDINTATTNKILMTTENLMTRDNPDKNTTDNPYRPTYSGPISGIAITSAEPEVTSNANSTGSEAEHDCSVKTKFNGVIFLCVVFVVPSLVVAVQA